MKPTTASAPRDHSSEMEGRRETVARCYRGVMEDPKKRDGLIEDHLPLVKSIVTRMRHHFPETIETDDLYGIGVNALVISANRFDPSKGRTFGSYAGQRVKGALLDELRRIDCLPRANRAKARSLQATIEELEARHKRPATEEEVRESLGIGEVEYRKLLSDVRPVTFIPIDASPDGGDPDESGPATLAEALFDPTQSDARDHAQKREQVEQLRDRIKELPDQQKKILALYYYEEMKLAEIAQIFSLTEGRISQILSHTLMSLRSHFRMLECKQTKPART